MIDTLEAVAPAGSVVLFDGASSDGWTTRAGAPAAWRVADEVLHVTAGAGDIMTGRRFCDHFLHLEFRCPDPSCNPYLTFSAMLMAAMDGIVNKIDPGQPLDKDIYDLPPEELAKVPKTPGSLRDVLKALEADHEFLLKGDVFTPDVIETWVEYKMKNEVLAMDLRPHPWEFMLYFDT